MWNIARTPIRVAIATLALLLTYVGVITPLVDTLPQCRRVEAWVTSHAQSLPTSYDGLLAFPKAYRNAIFNVLPANAKARIWRTHLDRALTASASTLTDSQRAFVARARDLIKSEYYVRPRPPAVQEEVSQLFAEAGVLFANSPRKSILLELDGPVSLAGFRMDATLLHLKATLGRSLVASAQEWINCGDCKCAIDYQFVWTCPMAGNCMYPPYPYYCQERSWGCGWFGLLQCNGLCCSWDGGSCYCG